MERLEECPACQSRELGRRAPWLERPSLACGAEVESLEQCARCSLVFVNPRPPAERLERSAGADHPAESSCRRDEGAALEQALELVARHVPEIGTPRLLDFGCGDGRLLERALGWGWDAVGYDGAACSVQQCRARGLPVLEQLNGGAGEPFDAIVLSHVLDRAADLPGLFSRLEPVVAPHTLLYIEVPNLDSLRARLLLPIPEGSRRGRGDSGPPSPRLYYFSPSTLPRLLARFGYEVTGTYSFGLGLGRVGPLNRVPDRVRALVEASLGKARLGDNLAVLGRKRRPVPPPSVLGDRASRWPS